MRNPADSVGLLDRVAARPYAFDFYYVRRQPRRGGPTSRG